MAALLPLLKPIWDGLKWVIAGDDHKGKKRWLLLLVLSASITANVLYFLQDKARSEARKNRGAVSNQPIPAATK